MCTNIQDCNSTSFLLIKKFNTDLTHCKIYPEYIIGYDNLDRIVIFDSCGNLILSHSINSTVDDKITRVLFPENSVYPYAAVCVTINSISSYLLCFDLKEIHRNACIKIKTKPTTFILLYDCLNSEDNSPLEYLFSMIGLEDGTILCLDLKRNGCHQCLNNTTGENCHMYYCSAQNLNSFMNCLTESISETHLAAVLYRNPSKINAPTSLHIVESINSIAVGFMNGDYILIDIYTFESLIYFKNDQEACFIRRFLSFKLNDDPRPCSFLIAVKSPPKPRQYFKIAILKLIYSTEKDSTNFDSPFNRYQNTIPQCLITFTCNPGDNTKSTVLTLESINILEDKASVFTHLILKRLDLKTKLSSFYSCIFDYNIYLTDDSPNIIEAHIGENFFQFKPENINCLCFSEIKSLEDSISIHSYSSISHMNHFHHSIRNDCDFSKFGRLHHSITVNIAGINSLFQYTINDSVTSFIKTLNTGSYDEKNELSLIPMSTECPKILNLLPKTVESLISACLNYGYTSVIASLCTQKMSIDSISEEIKSKLIKITNEACERILHFGTNILTSTPLDILDTINQLHILIGELKKISLVLESIRKTGASSNLGSLNSIDHLIRFSRILLVFYSAAMVEIDDESTENIENILWPLNDLNSSYTNSKAIMSLNRFDSLFIDRLIILLNTNLNSIKKSHLIRPFYYPNLSFNKFIETSFLCDGGKESFLTCYLFYALLSLHNCSPFYRKNMIKNQLRNIFNLKKCEYYIFKSFWLSDHGLWDKSFRLLARIEDPEIFTGFSAHLFLLIEKGIKTLKDSPYMEVIVSRLLPLYPSKQIGVLIKLIIQNDKTKLISSLLSNENIALHPFVLDFIVKECFEQKKFNQFISHFNDLLLPDPVFKSLRKYLSSNSPSTYACENISYPFSKILNPIPIDDRSQRSMSVDYLMPNASLRDFNLDIITPPYIYGYSRQILSCQTQITDKNLNTDIMDELSQRLASYSPHYSNEDNNSLSQTFSINTSHLEYYLEGHKVELTLPKFNSKRKPHLNESMGSSILKKRKKYPIHPSEEITTDSPSKSKKITFDLHSHLSKNDSNLFPLSPPSHFLKVKEVFGDFPSSETSICDNATARSTQEELNTHDIRTEEKKLDNYENLERLEEHETLINLNATEEQFLTEETEGHKNFDHEEEYTYLDVNEPLKSLEFNQDEGLVKTEENQPIDSQKEYNLRSRKNSTFVELADVSNSKLKKSKVGDNINVDTSNTTLNTSLLNSNMNITMSRSDLIENYLGGPNYFLRPRTRQTDSSISTPISKTKAAPDSSLLSSSKKTKTVRRKSTKPRRRVN